MSAELATSCKRPSKKCYYIDVFAKLPSHLDGLQIISNRKVFATSYSKAYDKIIDILRENGFIFDHIYIVINPEPF